MVPKKIRNVVRKFTQALKKAEFPAFRTVLFGSYARGEARQDSDIDLCLVSEKFRRNREKYRKEATMVAFGIDPRLQVIATDPQSLKTNHLSSLYIQIQREGISIS
ncbi:MAG: nucleotidyltransferase domain-containing protein [Deltaproteobacteria bacterium]|nr:nucleotidyltransferase domain-containing protein [Deltaproteobacteria bacterium]